ncbi:hypothetical protein [Burkholderia seminalis]|uniref:hypothetical protein n=1 Tax=Burkholderia seminalis TaxID=488731 RepID=UPI001452EF01|nr:hypothetical protein [Burkholderia seminalis]MCA8430068.1 hypothetical protein [Burkholderia seminalis]VWB16579.1 hypothetical protein BSE24067_00599 [Burkholderia seminalis]
MKCKPGDLARVVHSRNQALIGRVVRVDYPHGDGRWECELVGDPVVGLADDGEGLLLTRDWLFSDASLEPRVTDHPEILITFTEAFAL